MSVRPHAGNGSGSTLWMGDIDDDMSEQFIRTSFNLMNCNPLFVKLVRSKYPGRNYTGYGFITFENEEMAQTVLREVNGKPIPNSIQGKRFRLNNTSVREDQEFSVYVGDLAYTVTDQQLYAAFARRYSSVQSAKVMQSDGQSRRFGFVRFGHEADYRRALAECDQAPILGPQPVTVRAAKPRRPKINAFNNYKTRTFEANQEPVVPHVVPQTGDVPESVYGFDVSPYYGQVASGQPVLVYPVMYPGALPQYDTSYVYGQPGYGQQVYYQACDGVYSLVPSPIFMDQVGQSQLIDSKQMDKLSDDISRSEELYSSIESSRWSSQIDAMDSDKEKLQ